MNNSSESGLIAPFSYSETVSTWSARYMSPAGYVCLLSLQADTGEAVLKKAEAAIAYLVETKCLPAINNPNAKMEETKPDAIAEEKQPSKVADSFCPIHKSVMKQWTKNGKTWYSHRVNGKWCRGVAA